jgi:putative ABC transport system substrate-binding protein
MRRRDFIRAIAASATAWPLVAHAQSRRPGKLQTIGFLSDEVATPHLLHSHDWVFNRLRELGYVQGQNLVVHYRYADQNVQVLPTMAAELCARPLDVLFAVGTPATRAAMAATKSIPIVFSRIGDPVGLGMVSSLARPGGNATGVSVFATELAQKRLQLLRDQVPGLSRLAILHEPGFAPGDLELKQVTEAAASSKLQVHQLGLKNLAMLDSFAAQIAEQRSEALFVGSSGWFEDIHQAVVDFALKTRLPALFVRREYADIGGMMAYGIPYAEMYRSAADYVAKILGGENPGGLPVLQPTKVELVINIKTARGLGFEIASGLLVRADRVIE